MSMKDNKCKKIKENFSKKNIFRFGSYGFSNQYMLAIRKSEALIDLWFENQQNCVN